MGVVKFHYRRSDEKGQEDKPETGKGTNGVRSSQTMNNEDVN